MCVIILKEYVRVLKESFYKKQKLVAGRRRN